MNNLIETKTREYEDFPALILGLDGWVFKSVPKSLRAQFLGAYERALKIAFHPDREQNPVRKQSMERYLQRVSEAVRFLGSGEMEYELATDAAPSRRNPVVAMQREVLVRDEIIERIQNDTADHAKKEKELNAKVSQANAERTAWMSDSSKSQSKMKSLEDWLKNNAIRNVLIPTRATIANIKGRFITLEEAENYLRTQNSRKWNVQGNRDISIYKGRCRGFYLFGCVIPYMAVSLVNRRNEIPGEQAATLSWEDLRESSFGFIWKRGLLLLRHNDYSKNEAAVKYEAFLVTETSYDSIQVFNASSEVEMEKFKTERHGVEVALKDEIERQKLRVYALISERDSAISRKQYLEDANKDHRKEKRELEEQIERLYKELDE